MSIPYLFGKLGLDIKRVPSIPYHACREDQLVSCCACLMCFQMLHYQCYIICIFNTVLWLLFRVYCLSMKNFFLGVADIYDDYNHRQFILFGFP